MRSSSEGKGRFSRLRLLGGALLVPLLVSGCANPGQKRLDAFRNTLNQGDLVGGLEKVRSSKSLYGENSAFLWEMDLGVLHHYLGAWDSSIVHLERAEQIVEDLYARSVTNEAAALATNDNLRPYRPRGYERVLLAQYQLLNYLAKQDLQGALVEVRRGVLVLDRLGETDSGSYRGDGGLEYLHSLVYLAAGQKDNSLISLRRSLIAYQEGKVPLPQMVREDASLRLRRDPRGKIFESLGLQVVADPIHARTLEQSPGEIDLIVYQGRSPELGQIRAWGEWIKGGLFAWHWSDPQTGKEVTDAFPAPPMPGGATGETFHVNFTFPVLKDVDSKVERIEVQTPRESLQPDWISDTRVLLDQWLSDTHTATMVRTIVRVAARTFAAQKVKSNVKTGNPLLDLVANVGMDFAQGEIEQSDLRMCLWLPRRIGIVRVPLQPDVLALHARGLSSGGSVVAERSLGDVASEPAGHRFRIVAFPW
ncbi:MAG: hypothetical protein H6686_10110 [Fibrobacteria bacterium]|nr:hypothetical protein [Fibrobacteria bacterium]